MRKLYRVGLLAALPALLLVVTALASACGGDDASGDTGGDEGGDGAAGEVVVIAKDNFFEPTEITIAKGEKVTIRLKNEGTAIHNMVVQDTDFKSDQIVNGGDESTFEVQFDEAGTYDFICEYHVPDMAGTIVVQ